ncbi:MAG: hypothetical protein LQ351_005429 [Letrouitia transgressa]|nr:MAG: hypothetical protein LQ351_005429 [Letrouitia transgressa]
MAKGLQPAKKQMSRRSIKLNARVVSGSWVPAEESVGRSRREASVVFGCCRAAERVNGGSLVERKDMQLADGISEAFDPFAPPRATKGIACASERLHFCCRSVRHVELTTTGRCRGGGGGGGGRAGGEDSRERIWLENGEMREVRGLLQSKKRLRLTG